MAGSRSAGLTELAVAGDRAANVAVGALAGEIARAVEAVESAAAGAVIDGAAVAAGNEWEVGADTPECASSQATTLKLISRSRPIAIAQTGGRREGRTIRASSSAGPACR